MDRFQQPDLIAARAKMRFRSLAVSGSKKPALLTLDEVQLVCEYSLASISRQDDFVLQSRVLQQIRDR